MSRNAAYNNRVPPHYDRRFSMEQIFYPAFIFASHDGVEQSIESPGVVVKRRSQPHDEASIKTSIVRCDANGGAGGFDCTACRFDRYFAVAVDSEWYCWHDIDVRGNPDQHFGEHGFSQR